MQGLRSIDKKRVAAGLGVAIAALIAWRGLTRGSGDAEGKNAPAAVAVDTAPVVRADVPVYVQGLGSVQAFYSVAVTSRVDGELVRVAFTEGQHVRKGDLLAQIDARPNQAALEQALAAKAKDEAQLANAKLDLGRYTALQPHDLASKQTVDTQRAVVDQLAAQLKVDQALIDGARAQLDYTRITSPIEGRTGIRMVDPGNIVHAANSTPIVVVAQIQPISVVFTLPAEQIGAVARALAAGPVPVWTVTPDGSADPEAGTLQLIDNQVDAATGTVKLKATFPNTHEKLWPGQFVNARLLVRTDRNALTIPEAAVQFGPNGPFTYVVGKDSTVEVRPLAVGSGGAGMTAVTHGLAAGERVVTTNQYRLQAGTHVRAAS